MSRAKKKGPHTSLPHSRALVAATVGAALAVSLGVWAAVKSGGNLPQETPPTANIEKVRVTIHTVPPRRAVVKWGRKTLGTIPAPRPLIVERPRDSGPLDIVIRASGYLPVHTRAYTFSDSRVAVKLTPVTAKHTLFGYKQEAAPDGGIPAETPALPAAPVPAAPVPTAPVALPPVP